MGKKVKEREEPKLVSTPRITPMDEVEYVQGYVSQYLAISRIKFVITDRLKSEWDNEVSRVFKTPYDDFKSGIEWWSSRLALKEKGLDLITINLNDFVPTIKEILHNYGPIFNKNSVLWKYRKLLLSRVVLGFHILADALLPARDKELIVLRSAWLCRSEYIWNHHTFPAKQAGLSNDEIKHIKGDLNFQEWDAFDHTLISATDDLYTDAILSESVWDSQSQRYDKFQLMDLVFTVGFYILLSTALNAFKIHSEKVVMDYIKEEELPSFENENNSLRSKRSISKTEPFRLDKPRFIPLNEVEYVNELLMLHKSLNRIKCTKREKIETIWEREYHSLIEWLKNYNKQEIDNLSSFLNLEDEGLDIYSINLKEYEDSVKTFIIKEGTLFNLKAIMMIYRKLRLSWIIQASHTTYDSSLPLRDKEILILRVAWLCRAQYEWDHHVIVGRRAGLTDEEINRIKDRPDTEKLDVFDEVLIQSADELYRNASLSDLSWDTLSKQYTTHQLMDLVFIVTSYNLLGMFLNSFGIQMEDCVKKLLE